MTVKQINNDIPKDYCSFELSSLLKENGFDVKCEKAYFNYTNTNPKLKDNIVELLSPKPDIFGNDYLFQNSVDFVENEIEWSVINNNCTAPTHTVAVEWVSENYDTRIVVTPHKSSGLRIPTRKYTVSLFTFLDGSDAICEALKINGEVASFLSPYVATEQALLHVLSLSKKELKNDIQLSACSLEIAKLLKKKGFDCPTKEWYQFGGGAVGLLTGKKEKHNSKKTYCFSAPSPTLAAEWIWANFQLWIQAYLIKENKFNPMVLDSNLNRIDNMKNATYDSPQEAVEAALLYTLNEVI